MWTHRQYQPINACWVQGTNSKQQQATYVCLYAFWYCLILKTKALQSFKMSGTIHRITQHHIPEDSNASVKTSNLTNRSLLWKTTCRRSSCLLLPLILITSSLMVNKYILSISENIIQEIRCDNKLNHNSSKKPNEYLSNLLTLILRRSRTGTAWFYTSTSNKRAARPKLYTKSLTRDLKLMYSRLTLVRININL